MPVARCRNSFRICLEFYANRAIINTLQIERGGQMAKPEKDHDLEHKKKVLHRTMRTEQVVLIVSTIVVLIIIAVMAMRVIQG